MPAVEYLTPAAFGALRTFWRDSFPLCPMTDPLLKERVFDPPDATPDTLLCHRDSAGSILALSLLVPPRTSRKSPEELVGGIRWFGVHPAVRGTGIGTALLNESCERLEAAGAGAVHLVATPPYYIRPGVDIRLTGVISWLLRRGFEYHKTNFNMSVDMESLRCPAAEKIFPADERGYRVRRATVEDRSAFKAYCLREWTANWHAEAAQGLHHDPCSLFLAVKSFEQAEEEVVGFAVYEANQGPGCFGPTGVSPAHQGHGLGKRLLWATLRDMQQLGRKRCEIGWVGPVDFYHRIVRATIGPVFWAMKKSL